MIKKLMLFLLCSFSITLLSCSNKSTNSDSTTQNNSNTITIKSSQSNQNSIVFLGDTSLSPNIFYPFLDKNIFVDWRDGNKLATFPKALTKDMFPNLKNENTYNITSSSSSIAVYGDKIIYSDNVGSLHTTSQDLKSSTKLSDDYAYNLILSGDDLYYINKNNNNVITKYNLKNNTKTALTQDSSGKFIIVGDWVLYQNASDSSRIYGVKSDGTSRTKLSNSSVESFALYKNNIIFVNSSDNDNLYLLLIDKSEEKKILDVTAQDLHSINNTVFFINKNDLNYLYSLSETGELKFSSTKISKDSVVDYYLFENSIFYKRSLSTDSEIHRIENAYK
ncbi:DUF5050 domain-containing protein [Clostridium intestinale]|uniref:DUF5050 domain-containing protein n=1 Tax=Clostridium intestinale TaxID=36845 RepID=A0A7D6VQL1_9CLOT|nr:DUF5050 domain-containing protein [Clostridium intestinale]QLY79588.1 DUF5050 domain-containing protein [Clostridium intestinale]